MTVGTVIEIVFRIRADLTGFAEIVSHRLLCLGEHSLKLIEKSESNKFGYLTTGLT